MFQLSYLLIFICLISICEVEECINFIHKIEHSQQQVSAESQEKAADDLNNFQSRHQNQSRMDLDSTDLFQSVVELDL